MTIEQLISEAPNFKDIDKVSEWFYDCKIFFNNDEEALKEIDKGLFFLGNYSRREEYVAKILGRLKSIYKNVYQQNK